MPAPSTAFRQVHSDVSGYLMAQQRLETCSPACRVLVVDDDALTRKSLLGLLQRQLYDVVLASSGEEALRVMHTAPCDIVLTDWQMPNMDGLALCRSLRRSYAQDDVYVLLLTVRQGEQDRRAALAAGADDYVVKGSPIREVLEHLNAGRIARSRRVSEPAAAVLQPSLTDPLTGTHNLRFFIEQLPREIERAHYSRHALAVLSCGIDAFAQAVSRHGQDVADEALRAFVSATNPYLRRGEGWLARVAENQFVIALRETRLRGAQREARIVRKVFSRVPVRTRLGPMRFTVSIVVAACAAKRQTLLKKLSSL
jgi:two-component system cell cycle response regulator